MKKSRVIVGLVAVTVLGVAIASIVRKEREGMRELEEFDEELFEDFLTEEDDCEGGLDFISMERFDNTVVSKSDIKELYDIIKGTPVALVIADEVMELEGSEYVDTVDNSYNCILRDKELALKNGVYISEKQLNNGKFILGFNEGILNGSLYHARLIEDRDGKVIGVVCIKYKN